MQLSLGYSKRILNTQEVHNTTEININTLTFYLTALMLQSWRTRTQWQYSSFCTDQLTLKTHFLLYKWQICIKNPAQFRLQQQENKNKAKHTMFIWANLKRNEGNASSLTALQGNYREKNSCSTLNKTKKASQNHFTKPSSPTGMSSYNHAYKTAHFLGNWKPACFKYYGESTQHIPWQHPSTSHHRNIQGKWLL